MLFTQGWSCGARNGSLPDDKRAEDSDYLNGHREGRVARSAAAEIAAQVYGYEPSVLRLASEELICTCCSKPVVEDDLVMITETAWHKECWQETLHDRR